MALARWNKTNARYYLGDVRSSYFGYSLMDLVRENAASGGITATILMEALREKQIDGALVCRSRIRDNQVELVYYIARSEAEILASQGSKYIAGRFAANALPLIRDFRGNLAVVCLPCEARMLAHLRRKDPQVDRKLKLVIALFCGHSSEKDLTDLVLRKLNPHNKPIEDLRYRFGHWRGQLRVQFEDGSQITKKFSTFSDYQNLFFFAERKCLQCSDQTGFYSDISMGDIWSLKMKDDPIKHNAILTRSWAGETVIQAVREKDLANVLPVAVEEVCAGQSRSLPLHAGVNARARVGRQFGERIVPVSEAQPGFLEKWIARIVLFNYRFSHTEKGRSVIQKMPRFLLRFYLYVFKALQVLQSPKQIQYTIAIMGGSIWGNRGAESMLVTTIGMLKEKYPLANFKAFSIYPQKDQQLNGDEQVEILNSKPLSLALKYFPWALLYGMCSKLGIRIWLPSEVRKLRDCSMMVDIGGITFAERGPVLLYNIFSLWPAMLLGVPVVKLSQALGPFRSPLNRFFAKRFLGRCEKVFPRGVISQGYMDELKLGKERFGQVAGDIAFLYKPDYSLSLENQSAVSALSEKLSQDRRDGKKLIFFLPSSVLLKKMGSLQHETMFLDAIEKIDRENFVYVFLPNSSRLESGGFRNNDICVIQKMHVAAEKRLPELCRGRMEWVEWDLNTSGLRQLMQHANMVISSRFHGMVSALALGKPVYVVGWSHKYAEVLRAFGLEEHAVDFKNVNAESLARGILLVLSDRENIERKIRASLPEVTASARSQFEELDISLPPLDELIQ